MFELLFVERDVVIAGDVLKRLEKIVLEVFFPLLLLNDDSPFKIEVVFLFEDVVKGRVSASIDANLLELVAEVILDGLLLELVPLDDDVVLPFKHEAVDDEVLFLQQVCFLEEAYNLLSIDIIVAFLDVHGDEIKGRLADFFPFLLELFVLFHNVIVVEDGKTELVLVHLRFQVFEHHVGKAKFFVCCHVLCVRELPVESHDRPEGVSLWNQTEFTRGEIVVLTV